MLPMCLQRSWEAQLLRVRRSETKLDGRKISSRVHYTYNEKL